MMTLRLSFLNLAVVAIALFGTADAATRMVPFGNRFLLPIKVGLRSATTSTSSSVHQQRQYSPITNTNIGSSSDVLIRGGGGGDAASSCDCKPPVKALKWAYTAAGLATTSAWATMVYTTIRSNQPQGAMMPCAQHPFFARMGVMAAAPIILGSFASLAHSVSKSNAQSWEELGDENGDSFRRHNLALATTGVASSLWVRFAETVTKIPGSNPLASHQVYSTGMQARLIGCYGGAAALGAAVWALSLPAEVRRNPLSWPTRIADGVSKSLLSIAPRDVDDPVQVKYSLLTASFLVFTGLGTLCNMPIAVIPSWTARRLSRALPIYTFLGAVTAFDLKEATENGRLLVDDKCRYLSNGIKGFGGLYLGAKTGAVFLDPSFPASYHIVQQVPGLAVAAIVMVGLTLRSDKK